MPNDENDLHRLDVRIGTTLTVCYFDSPIEFEKAREFAGQLGIGPVADKDITSMPQDCFVADATEFRNTTIGQILADRGLCLTHSDALDSLFSDRIVEVRNALRAEGWTGDAYGTLTKDGAKAMFKFDHVANGRNVIGMSVNGITDALVRPAQDIAREVTRAAQGHLKLNRRVDVLIVAQDGSKGSYSVAFGEAGHVVQTSAQWKPEPPDVGLQEVRLRMRRYGRIEGSPCIVSGDAWREMECAGTTDTLYVDLLSGASAKNAVSAALGIVENASSAIAGDLEAARRKAGTFGLTHTRVADQSSHLPNVGTIMAITPAYVVQSIGMNNAVLHRVDNFEKLPVLGGRVDIRYDGGKAVLYEGRTKGHMFTR